MSYIGATQGTSSPVLLDAITVVNGQASYTMQKGGVNYTPASTLVMQVSLNGIIQQPGGGSYTINGSTITFASALVTGDVIDYILVREPTTGTIAPIDSSVTDSKIVSMASSKLTGALPAIDGSALTGISSSISCAVVLDQKSNATTGGTFASGAWRTRDLNTKTDPDNIVTLANNQITLGVGTYNIYFSAPAFKTQTHHTRLYNVTDSSIAGYGSNAVQNATAEDSNHSMGWALVTISSGTKTFEVQHIRSSGTQSNNGFGIAQAGVAGNVGLPETYTVVNIMKVG